MCLWDQSNHYKVQEWLLPPIQVYSFPKKVNESVLALLMIDFGKKFMIILQYSYRKRKLLDDIESCASSSLLCIESFSYRSSHTHNELYSHFEDEYFHAT